jgi:hypothetical protein
LTQLKLLLWTPARFEPEFPIIKHEIRHHLWKYSIEPSTIAALRGVLQKLLIQPSIP